MKFKPIHEQVVVLFGATSGIGLETALQFVEKGARVALVGRDEESVNQAVERVRQHAHSAQMVMASDSGNRSGGNNVSTHMGEDQQVIGLVADVTNWDQVRSTAERAMAHFGRIDTWVHLAAVSEWALFEDTSPDEFRRVIDVNLTGMAFGAMAALPYLKQQERGALIFVSSVAGRMPLPYQSAYSASKHGILALASSLRMELKHEGVPVSVTTIMPSSINTPLFNKARTKLGVEPHPIPPIYDPSLVAQAIVYAAHHRIREIPVGGAGWALQLTRRLSPRLAERYMRTTGFKQQRSDEPKSAMAPDNLYEHTEGYDQVIGEYSPKARKFSMQLWLATHPAARTALRLAAFAGLGFLAYRLIRGRREPSFWERARFWERPPFRREHHWYENLGDLLAGLPLISLLPFFNQPSLPKRMQRGVQKQIQKVHLDPPAKMAKRLGDRLPIGKQDTVLDKVQERLPIRQREKFVDKVQGRYEDVRNTRIKDRIPFRD